MIKGSSKKITSWWKNYWTIMDFVNGDNSWHGVARGALTIIASFIVLLSFLFVMSRFSMSEVLVIIEFPMLFPPVFMIFLGIWHLWFSILMLFDKPQKEEVGE